MRDTEAGTTLYVALWPTVGDPRPTRAIHIAPVRGGNGMECTDWLDEGLNPAQARFLMLTAITHHEFSSPIWGEHEVRKLHAELTELDRLATQALVDDSAARSTWRRASTRSLPLAGRRGWVPARQTPWLR
jgi:hypothetical protein